MNKTREHLLTEESKELLRKLRQSSPTRKKVKWDAENQSQHLSDVMTQAIGSWPFIIIQAVLLFIWMVLNTIAWIKAWDPYPFILLNLVLSFQSAFTAPVIMMSQNRQNRIDRNRAENDYEVNIKAELEIEQLHEKIELLRTQEIKQLLDIIQALEKKVC